MRNGEHIWTRQIVGRQHWPHALKRRMLDVTFMLLLVVAGHGSADSVSITRYLEIEPFPVLTLDNTVVHVSALIEWRVVSFPLFDEKLSLSRETAEEWMEYRLKIEVHETILGVSSKAVRELIASLDDPIMTETRSRFMESIRRAVNSGGTRDGVAYPQPSDIGLEILAVELFRTTG